MKITLESTAEVGMLGIDGCEVPARIWVGSTESGIPVMAFITRIGVLAGGDPTEFERELTEAPTFVVDAPRDVCEHGFSREVDQHGTPICDRCTKPEGHA